jgi:hypothetical protein
MRAALPVNCPLPDSLPALPANCTLPVSLCRHDRLNCWPPSLCCRCLLLGRHNLPCCLQSHCAWLHALRVALCALRVEIGARCLVPFALLCALRCARLPSRRWHSDCLGWCSHYLCCRSYCLSLQLRTKMGSGRIDARCDRSDTRNENRTSCDRSDCLLLLLLLFRTASFFCHMLATSSQDAGVEHRTAFFL